MIPLGNHIDKELRKLHGRVYHEEAPQDAELPYITYNFPTSNENYQREDFILEIDVWGKAPYTVPLETLVNSIDSALHRSQYYAAGVVQASTYRINRLAIPDPDQDIRRRQLRYQVHTYL